MLARRSRHLPTTVGRMDGLQFHDIDSPIGRLGLVISSRGVAKVLLEADDIEAQRARIGEQAEVPLAAHQLTEYFAGRRQQFTVPLDFRFATDFHRQVLEELARVPYGVTTTYKALAERVGNPKAVRAVGSACARNPLPLLVPCHRVLRADGSLGGYRGGKQAKRFLLNLEGNNV
ncbi:hypothetical protein HMPREF2550_05635 [Corynebacterium sp. HMSC074A01]|nr:hypothetical protein HMPREF2550_05635 [Corynebacterium sp. HMSC074A01]